MTRDELLAAFEAALNGFLLPATGRNPSWQVMPDDKSAITQSEDSVDAQHTLEVHICYCWDADLLNVRNAQFYVVDRGEIGEAAYWIRGNDPKSPTPDPTFRQEMTAWLQGQIDQTFGSSVLRHVETITANDAVERGTAEVIMDNAGTFSRVSVAVWQNASDEWQFKAISDT